MKKIIKLNRKFQFTTKQQIILKTMMQDDTKMVMIDGLYGTGKTYVAIYAALQLLADNRIEGITYLRNPIESSTEGKIGYLPGEAEEKIDPYMAPLKEKISEIAHTSAKQLPIEMDVMGFIRGRDFRDRVVIIDEAASLTEDDLILLATRMGKDSKLFIIGDSRNQSDLKKNQSGLAGFVSKFSDEESEAQGIYTFTLKDENDIVRSGLVKFVLKKCGKI